MRCALLAALALGSMARASDPFCTGAALTGTFGGGNGSAATPYQICTLTQLDHIRGAYLASNFELRADLDAAITSPGDPANAGSAWNNGGLGFQPIGDCGPDAACYTADDLPFTGKFDGRNHLISNLYIHRPAATTVGMFGFVRGTGITNLHLRSAQIGGTNGVGALVGVDQAGNLAHCTSSGQVSGVGNVGGLVGGVGQPSGPGVPNVVSDCASSATVSGVTSVGGLVGFLEWGATVQRGVASGTVTGTGPTASGAGGLVGYLYSCSIRDSAASGAVSGVTSVGGLTGSQDFSSEANCYATGAVTGTTEVGGLIGSAGNTTLSSSFSIGTVTGSTSVGGLLGKKWNGTVCNCRWDRTGPDRPDVMCGVVGPGCDDSLFVDGIVDYWFVSTNAPMTAPTGSSCPGWDLTAVWVGITGSLPQLRQLAASECGVGPQCQSGQCVEGVCCDTACAGGACLSCNGQLGAAQSGVCGPRSPEIVCRAASGGCDVAETCDGVSPSCPVDLRAPDGADCSDGDPCTQTDQCQTGVCVGANPLVCPAVDGCHSAGQCDAGACTNPVKPDGTGCEDGDACTASDTCQQGSCTAGAASGCAAPDACHDPGVCAPLTGVCSYTARAAGCAVHFTSSPDPTARCGQAWRYAPVISGDGAPSFSVGAAPAGLTIDASSGVIRWVPDHSEVGPQSFDLVVTSSSGTDLQHVEVEVACVPETFTSRCDCSAAEGGVIPLVLALAALRRRRA